MSAFLRALSRRVRLALHRHDRIECWCELTDVAPPKIPVQGPGTLCPTCWVSPGDEHTLSCPEVSRELFAEFLAWKTSPSRPEARR